MNQTRNQLFKHTFWASAAALSNSLFGITYLILIGNYWKSEGLGIFSLSLSMYIISSTIFNIGIHNAALYKVASSGIDELQASVAAYTGMILSLVLGFLGGVILFFSSSFLGELFQHDHIGMMIKLYAVALPLFLINKTMAGILNAHFRMRVLASTDFLRGFILCVYIVTLIFFGLSYLTIPVGVIFSEICIFIILSISCFRIHKPKLPSTTVIKKLINFGWKTSLLNIIADLDLRLDILFIGFFADTSRVGIYTIAASIAKAFWLFPTAIQKVTNPLFVSLYTEGNLEKIHRVLDVLLRLGTVSFVFIGCLLVIFVKPILYFLFPAQPDLVSAIYPLYLLLPGTVIFTGIAMLASAPCASIGHPENSIKYISIRIAVNALMNLILVPFLFENGAALATTISILVSLGYYAYLFKKFLMFSVPLKQLFFLLSTFCLFLYLKVLFENLTSWYSFLCLFIILVLVIVFYFMGIIKHDDKKLLSALIDVPAK
jgi:O-antigen/teichoic acid export membrane protein